MALSLADESDAQAGAVSGDGQFSILCLVPSVPWWKRLQCPHGKTTAPAPTVPRQSVTFTRLQATDQTDFAIVRKLLLRHFHVSANQIAQGQSLRRRHADC